MKPADQQAAYARLVRDAILKAKRAALAGEFGEVDEAARIELEAFIREHDAAARGER